MAPHNPLQGPRLTGPLPLLLLVLVVGAFFAAISIHNGWRLKNTQGNGSVSSTPRQDTARLLASSGQFAAAHEQLAPLLKNSRLPFYHAARWLSWQLYWQENMSLPVGGAARANAWKILRQRTANLIRLGGWTAPQWQTLAESAAALGAPRASASAWTQAARADPRRAIYFKAMEARTWAAADQATRAGDIDLTLTGESLSPDRQRAFFLNGLRLVEGGSGAKVAFTKAEQALQKNPQLIHDYNVNLRMATLAMSNDNPQVAAEILLGVLLQGPPNHEASAQH